MGRDSLHILVVDDVADVADSSAELLNLWGYVARAHYSGAAALASARVRRPDVVLLDLAMPRMDGFRFAALFRALPRCAAVPIVAVSGYSTPEYIARARATGIRYFLLKASHPDRLRELLAWEIVPAVARQPRRRHRFRLQELVVPKFIAAQEVLN
jgi:CheY-like chemotaxis protein